MPPTPPCRVGFAHHFLLALWLPLFSACGPSTGAVTGSVTVDGQPLASGVISYVPADRTGPPATANIENGKYSVQTTTGKKFVQLSAPVVVGKRKEYEGPDAPLVEITDELLPSRYNTTTELTFDVRPGQNTKDWSVASERRKP